MKNPLFAAALAGLTALSACGGTTGASATLLPVTKNVGGATNLGGTVPSATADGVQLPITNNGIQIAGVLKEANISNGSFGGGMDPAAGNLSYDVIAFSDDGKSNPGQIARIEATVIGSASSSGIGFGQIAYYGRVIDTLLPVGGGATYTTQGQTAGGYRATYGSSTAGINGSVNGGLIAITGDPSLTANFNNSTISGMITNRTSLLSDGSTPDTFADVTLSNTAITNTGTFNGNASGGANGTQPTSTAGTGTYEGLFGGTNSDSITGALLLTYTVGADTFSEVGVFTGKR